MAQAVKIGEKWIGSGHPAYVIAEVGINHNGDIDTAKRLIDSAVISGCDAVKFQKRNWKECLRPEQRDIMRETPWGTITNLEYRRHLELEHDDYKEIDRYCKARGIAWFASPWDEESVDFLERFAPVCYKVASIHVSDMPLLKYVASKKRPVILSTGMHSMEEICEAVSLFDPDHLMLMHTTSAYPCKPDQLNLRMIQTLQAKFGLPVGYSGHEVGLQTTYAAVVLGACAIERHITLDRAMWGSDQAASVEPAGFMRLVRDIRTIESALGDGVKVVYDTEKPIREKLRRAHA